MVCLFEIFATITVTNSIHKPKNPPKIPNNLIGIRKKEGIKSLQRNKFNVSKTFNLYNLQVF